jgi:hypothetical protein
MSARPRPGRDTALVILDPCEPVRQHVLYDIWAGLQRIGYTPAGAREVLLNLGVSVADVVRVLDPDVVGG